MKQTSAESRIEFKLARFFECGEEKAAIEREESGLKEEIEEYMLDNRLDEMPLEGKGVVKWETQTIRNFDVRLIAAQEPHLFQRLLDLNVLTISATKLDSMQSLIGVRVPHTKGEKRFIKRDRSKR